ncbi:MAG: hypothetical protein Kow0068_10470 [Marinilabiliales bacterium]
MLNFKVRSQFNNNISKYYELYKNVKNNSLSLNTFDLPEKLFNKIAENTDWEVIELRDSQSNSIISVVFCCKSGNCYSAVIIGMDYSVEKSLHLYKQSLYQIIKRGLELKAEKIYLGVTASETKRKFGATPVKQVGFIQMKDNYNISLLESIKKNLVNTNN